MSRYILLQYMHGERSDATSSVTRTFDHIKDAQTFAGNRLSDFNEIVDSDTWQVVWRLNKPSSPHPTVTPLQLVPEPHGWEQFASRRNRQ
jgi:hypothetical protein